MIDRAAAWLDERVRERVGVHVTRQGRPLADVTGPLRVTRLDGDGLRLAVGDATVDLRGREVRSVRVAEDGRLGVGLGDGLAVLVEELRAP